MRSLDTARAVRLLDRRVAIPAEPRFHPLRVMCAIAFRGGLAVDTGPARRKGPEMPGLLRGVARTAVIAGTATSVSNRVSRRQGNRWAQQEQPAEPAPAPAAAPAGGGDRVQQLKDLAGLKEQGVLTEAEFEAEKARILAS
jgi:hypothetical protein